MTKSVPLTMTRRAFIASLPVLACSAPAVAGEGGSLMSLLDTVRPAKRQPSVFIGVIDVSASSGPGEMYRAALAEFLRSATVGDQILLTVVSDSRRQVVPVVETIKPTGNSLLDKRSVKKAWTSAMGFVDRAIAGPRSDGTLLIETLSLLRPYVSAALERGYHPRALICSDGVEVSSLANFTRFPQDKVARLLKDLEKRNLFLADPGRKADQAVEIMFCGVGGEALPQAAVVETFWREYANVARLDMTFFGPGAPPVL